MRWKVALTRTHLELNRSCCSTPGAELRHEIVFSTVVFVKGTCQEDTTRTFWRVLLFLDSTLVDKLGSHAGSITNSTETAVKLKKSRLVCDFQKKLANRPGPKILENGLRFFFLRAVIASTDMRVSLAQVRLAGSACLRGLPSMIAAYLGSMITPSQTPYTC